MYQQSESNFYVNGYDNEELSIIPLKKTQIKSDEDIEICLDPISIQTENTYQVVEVRRTRKKKQETHEISNEQSRICSECGKKLASTASLYVHLKSHSSNKPYACTECGANFTRKYYLEVHHRTHTGERPYKCDICNKYFSQKSSLNTHRRKHTGEKPYECAICQKAFSAQSYLVSHQWTHYKKIDGVFTCTSCNVNFVSRSHFADHIRSHVNPLRYECEYCSKKFSKESHLIRHRNGAHSGNE